MGKERRDETIVGWSDSLGSTYEARSLALLRLELPECDPVSTLCSSVEKVFLVAREESIQVPVYLLLRVVDGINRLNL